jgi:uncharacterized phage protein (TIGR02220 family)
MRQFVIPEKFFLSLAEKPKLYTRLWFEWLSGYADDIFEPDFLEKINYTFYNKDEIKEIWVFGVLLLRQGDFTIIDKSKKIKRVYKKSDPQKQQIIIKVIEYLNAKVETSYLATTESTVDLISGRLSEGFKLEDFFTVIDNKVTDWRGSDYEKFLRPQTLFGKEKFENYLNAKITKNGTGNSGDTKIEQFGKDLNRAKQSFLVGKE